MSHHGWRTTVVRALNLLGWPGRIAVLALMLHVTLDTFLRKTVGDPIDGTLEYVQFWYMPAIALLGFVAAELQDDHMTAPVLYERMSRTMRRELSLLAAVVTVVVLLAFAWLGMEEAILQFERGATGPVSGIVIWPAVFLVPLASVATAIAVLLGQLEGRWERYSDEDPIEAEVTHHIAAAAGGR
jgi:TRAP-type C4-dicarboxylate transport system permease small subunit